MSMKNLLTITVLCATIAVGKWNANESRHSPKMQKHLNQTLSC